MGLIYMTEFIHETVLHRMLVVRSIDMLCEELEGKGVKGFTEELKQRAQRHDVTKMGNLDEFLALSSIIPYKKSMENVTNTLPDFIREIPLVHSTNLVNDHHPEAQALTKKGVNGTRPTILMETVCDWNARSIQNGTNLEAFANANMGPRFGYDVKQQKRLLYLCGLLKNAGDSEKYKDILDKGVTGAFETNNPVVSILYNLNIGMYESVIETSNLILCKQGTSDEYGVLYSVSLRGSGEKIGEVAVLSNGRLSFLINKAYEDRCFEKEILAYFKKKEYYDEHSDIRYLMSLSDDKSVSIYTEEKYNKQAIDKYGNKTAFLPPIDYRDVNGIVPFTLSIKKG